ncbi:MAG TPA: phosphatidate cytidylyltransferase [Bryobacteraceae bacterium]|nr:phosphatidate cytidylyltransferase [Bryobacteraceae bacterium]
MKRVVTALCLVPIAVYTALFAPPWLVVAVVGIVAVLAFREYAAITGSFAPLGYGAGILILVAPQHETILLMILSAMAAMCLMLAAEDPAKGLMRVSALTLGIIYVFGSWKTGLLLHDLNPHWLMFGLMVNWVGDTGAYYVGKNFGRHKLAPAVSPGKTWEGAAASAVTGVAFGMIYLPLTIKGTSLIVAGLLALAVNVAGQVGDLAESAIKRGAGVKDSGSLLPGHGGLLDRVDSTMFALPVLYTVLTFLH